MLAKRCGPSGCVLFVLGLRCVPSVRAVEGLKSRATPRLKTIRARMAISGRLPGISDLSSVHTRPQRVEHAKHQSGFTTQAQSSGQQRLASIPPHHEHQLKEPTHNLHLLSYLRPMVSDGGLPPSINCGRMGKKGLIRVSQKQHTARWPTSLGWHPPPTRSTINYCITMYMTHCQVGGCIVITKHQSFK